MGKRKGTKSAYKRRDSAKPVRRRKRADARGQLALLSRLPQSSAAWALGVTSRTLRDAVDAPRLADGRYDLRVLLAWWIEREKRKQPAGPSPAKERILAAQAAALERKNAIELGKLMDVESGAHTVRWILTTYQNRLQAIKDGVEPQVAGELQAAIDSVRKDFEKAFPAMAAEEADIFTANGGPGAAAH